MLKSYRDLEAWQIAMELTEKVYQLTQALPTDERFGLTAQLRRAAVSIPANIAEGYGRSHRKEYLHHLSIANGSLCEVETLLMLAHRLEYVNRENLEEPWKHAERVGQLLTRLMQSLKRPE